VAGACVFDLLAERGDDGGLDALEAVLEIQRGDRSLE
jgi:hypothetical protein